MSDRRDVTGTWYGRWTSPHPFVAPNSFIATLEEQGSRVSGSITEPDLHGPDILRAHVDGARAGGRIEFTKQYDGSGRLSHAVAYAGSINAAGTEVSGMWRIDRYSGNFSMVRESFSIEELEDERVIEVELTGR